MPPNSTMTHAGLRGPHVYRGRVLDVNVRLYTVAVAADFAKKVLTSISFAVPYAHPANGEGIYFMPEVGSTCWICEPSDGNKPFVVGWGAVPMQGDYRNNKMSLNPGDIYLGTRDENFLILRRGGVVQIGGGPLSQRMFLPINNTIKDFCENYGLYTLAGDFEWSIGRDENNTDGKRPAHVVLKARQFADNPEPVARLEIGSHDGDDETILSLLVWDSGDTGHSVKFSLFLDKAGNMQMKAEKDVDMTVMGKFDLTVEKDMTLSSKTKAIFRGKIQADLEGGIVNIKSTSGVVAIAAQAGLTVTSAKGVPAMKVGGASAPVMLAPAAVLSWLKTHTHQVSGVAGGSATVVSLKPVQPFPESAATSKDIKAS